MSSRFPPLPEGSEDVDLEDALQKLGPAGRAVAHGGHPVQLALTGDERR